jgi:hypothetical protein
VLAVEGALEVLAALDESLVELLVDELSLDDVADADEDVFDEPRLSVL